MAVRYATPEEKFRNVCTVSVSKELKDALEKWRVNLTVVADQMGMKRATLGNKIKGNNNAGFTPAEYQEFIRVIKSMAGDLSTPILNKYPVMNE